MAKPVYFRRPVAGQPQPPADDQGMTDEQKRAAAYTKALRDARDAGDGRRINQATWEQSGMQRVAEQKLGANDRLVQEARGAPQVQPTQQDRLDAQQRARQLQVQGATPRIEVRPSQQAQDALRRQAMAGVGGAPVGGAPPTPAAQDQRPLVEVKAPQIDMPSPLPQGAVAAQLYDHPAFAIGGKGRVYSGVEDYQNAKRERFLEDLRSAGSTGAQYGIYNPFAAPGEMAEQQRANYMMGQDQFLRSYAAMSEQEKNALSRELGLGDLAVKRGGLDVEAQKAMAQQAVEQARIASGESVAGLDRSSREGLAAKDLASKEQLARMGILGQMDQTRMQAAADLAKAQAQQRGINTGAWMTALLSNPDVSRVLTGGGDAALKKIDFLRSLNSQLGGPETSADAASLFQGFNANPELQRFLGQGGQPPIAVGGQPPPVQVQPPGQKPARQKDARDVIRDQGGALQFADEAAVMTALRGEGKDSLKKLGAQGIIDRLKGYGGETGGTQISEATIDRILKEAADEGLGQEEFKASLINELLRLQRNVGTPDGAPFRVRTGPQFSLSNPLVNPFKPVPLQVVGPGGEVIYAGEDAPPAFFQQQIRGTRDRITGNLRQQSDADDKRRIAVLQQLLGRYTQKYHSQK